MPRSWSTKNYNVRELYERVTMHPAMHSPPEQERIHDEAGVVKKNAQQVSFSHAAARQFRGMVFCFLFLCLGGGGGADKIIRIVLSRLLQPTSGTKLQRFNCSLIHNTGQIRSMNLRSMSQLAFNVFLWYTMPLVLKTSLHTLNWIVYYE